MIDSTENTFTKDPNKGNNNHGGKNYAYIRVSSKSQDLQIQREYMENTFDLWEIYSDVASGASIEKREGLQHLLQNMRPNDSLYVMSVDRLARDAKDLLNVISLFKNRGVDIHFCRENQIIKPDEINIMANFNITVMAGFAQLEREFLRARQQEGIEKAKKLGKFKGRKPLSSERVQRIQALHAIGIPKKRIAQELGVSITSVMKYTPRKNTSYRINKQDNSSQRNNDSLPNSLMKE